MSALIEGTLEKDSAGCLVVDGLVIVWPAGYTAEQTPAGTVEVLKPNGTVVGRTGSNLRAGGGSSANVATGPCMRGLPASGAFEVNDDLPALAIAEDPTLPHAAPTDDRPAAQEYYDSYIGMQRDDAEERATADGWLPRIVETGQPPDLTFNNVRLTLQVGDDGRVVKASRG